MTKRHFFSTTVLVATLLGSLACSSASSGTQDEQLPTSRVTSLEITSRQPAFGGKSFGAVGPYEVVLGKAKVVLDPRDPRNSVIVDLDKAPRNADGLIDYTVDIHILKPVDITKGNKVMMYEFNNRGRALVIGGFLEGIPTHTGISYGADQVGTGFVMNAGYTFVMSGWQTGNRAIPKDRLPAVYAQLPIAVENGQPVVGMSREEWMRDSPSKGQPQRRRLTYPAVSLDQSKATLTVRLNEADPRKPVPASNWRFIDDMTVEFNEAAGMEGGHIYEFIYEAKNSPVMGIGFAGLRDAVSFLRHRATDENGVANPLFVNGKPVLTHAISTGASQAGRAQRDFLNLGFNEDPVGRKVFDGMNPVVAGGRVTFTNHRFAQPGRYVRQHEDHLFPGAEFPFAFNTTTDALTGKTDGVFRRCEASKTCPKVIQVDSDSEGYQGLSSLVNTDTAGKAITLPSDVRLYYVTVAHMEWESEATRDRGHTVRPYPYFRAAYDALTRWVRDGVEPPPTKAPSVADGTWVTVAEQGKQYPKIPGKPYVAKINEVGARDYSVQPPAETGKYPVLVPRLDKDGNAAAGVLIPEILAPVGTVSGRAIRKKGYGENELYCNPVLGSFIPFPKTKQERLASGDSRLSLEERYPGGESQYAEQYKQAVDKLIAERYLLAEDGPRLIATKPPLFGEWPRGGRGSE